MPVLALLLAAPALAGWVATGPERGHVLDAAKGPTEVSVATRAGVMTAPSDLSAWRRDARFPAETRFVAWDDQGTAWAAPRGSIWRAGPTASRVVDLGRQSTVVDLEPLPGGGALAAVRGAEPGVWRLGATATRVLEGVDPWRISANDERVLVATVGGGLWQSIDGGAHFEVRLTEGTFTAISAEGPWAATEDGRLLSGPELAEVALLDGGWASAIVPRGGNALVVLDAAPQHDDRLLWWDGATLADATPTRLDEDRGPLTFTGAWALPGDDALVGTFRRGPARWHDGTLSTARHGFRATVGAAAAMDAQGRLLVTLLGTGVYVTADRGATWSPMHSGGGPVSDSVAAIATGDGFVVADFEGLSHVNLAGGAERLPALRPGQRVEITDLGVDGDGTWWVVTRDKALWRRSGVTWTPCSTTGALGLDGEGADLRLLTRVGPQEMGDCTRAGTALLPANVTERADSARAVGGWLVWNGQIWHDGVLAGRLPDGRVSALSVIDGEAWFGLESGDLVRCGTACDRPLGRLPSPAQAVGRFPDGTTWVLERKGSLLVAGGTEDPGAWYTQGALQGGDRALAALEAPPWNDETHGGAFQRKDHGDGAAMQAVTGQARPGNDPRRPLAPAAETPPTPAPTAHTAWWLILGGVVLAGGLGWWAYRRRSA